MHFDREMYRSARGHPRKISFYKCANFWRIFNSDRRLRIRLNFERDSTDLCENRREFIIELDTELFSI